MTDAAIEAVLRRDRLIVAAALALMIALAWAYVWWLATDMDMGGMDMSGFRMIPAGRGWMMPTAAPWTAMEFGFVFAMWAVMMIGMMTPSATPMVLVYARLGRQAARHGKSLPASAYFAAGYLVTWVGFALAATVAQWAMERSALLTPTMEGASDIFSGVVLIAAGIYQVLTALLFVGGVMNVLWIAAIAMLVLAEKVIPAGRAISRTAGAALVAAGVWLLAQAL
ncbi:MAG: DUF2182 domain-containing protein [Alphaproteobacteria bacterium]|nr:MAG: DUF2182 domain-containing protein [Alphaproteobacteria bacterium]